MIHNNLIEQISNTDKKSIARLNQLANYAKSQNLAFAFYKSPDSNSIETVIGHIKECECSYIPENSFAISDFNNDGKIWIIERTTEEIELYNSNAISYYSNSKLFDIKLLDYKNQVSKAVSSIKKQDFEKVVVSRRKKINFSHVNIFDYFNQLCEAYSNAFVSLVSTPKHGTWIGASPELLLKKEGNKISSVALAGTRTNEELQNKVDFNGKENIEQEIVSKYIREVFKKHGLKAIESGKDLLKAGDLYHLQTQFTIEGINGNIGDLLKDLHPTPATCGYPKAKALDYILNNEASPRELYSGFLGPVASKDQIELYVNLRCMQVFDDHAIVYAGAGIVEDSDPEKEFQETENKMKTLLSVLN